MVELLHEVWEEIDESGNALPGCCLAGPDGEDFRRLLGPGARLVRTFRAGSHFEAMNIYHRLLGREPYATNEEADHAPYPAEWLERQRAG